LKNNSIFFILLGFGLSFFSTEVYSQEPDLEQILLKNDESTLNQWLCNHDIEGFYSSCNYTPLIYSIIFNEPEIVKALIARGAKLETACDTKSPLLFALEYNRSSIARYLIRKGANVKVRDSLNNTPLFYAAAFDNIPIMRLLIRKGVPIEVKNKLKITARNYAVLCNRQKAARFLAYYFEKHLPNYCDGPYVRLKKNYIRIYYVLHDSIKHQSSMIIQRQDTKDKVISFKGFVSDTNSYTIDRNPQIEPDQYPLNRKIFVLGDVHGDYYGLINLLQKGNVIDKNLNWKWGSGHLVLLGDIVDRGEYVTECFWFINKLEQQARKQEGYVHYLLGNHEIMIMTKDYRYLADKYFYMNDQLKFDFAEHFSQNSFFRRWLSSKNSILKIGPYLFLHGGLSYDSFFLKYSISEMNSVIRQYLKNPKSKLYSDTIKWILSDNGPLWYRGYNAQFDSTKLINSTQLDSVLKFYKASTIFIGHTHTTEIKSVFNGRVILMDVPYYLDEGEPEAVKIDSMKIYLFNAKKLTEKELGQKF
jgi:hypothetical protein